MGRVFGALNKVEVDHWNETETGMELLSEGGRAKKNLVPTTVVRHLTSSDARARGISALADPTQLTPQHKGSDEEPDVELKVELVALHAGEGLDGGDQATLRADFGQSSQSRSRLKPLFWSIAAGLDLAKAMKSGKEGPSKLRGDFDDAFSGRPATIGGGLAEIRFEVVAHRPDRWWEEIFGFLETGAGRELTSFIGFPGIVDAAVDIINQAFDILDPKTKPLLSGPPIRAALSAYARDNFTGGSDAVKMGVLNPGFYVIMPARDIDLVNDAKPYFFGDYGVLLPHDLPPEKFTSSGEDPFEQVTYAVIKLKSLPAKITSSL